MDADETAAALVDEKRVELIARRTAELLCELDALQWRIDRLELLLLPRMDCANLLPI